MTDLGTLPEKWETVRLSDSRHFNILSSGIQLFTGTKNYLSTSSIQGSIIKSPECSITYNDRPSRANMQPRLRTVWFAKMKETVKVYSFTEYNSEDINEYILSTGFCGIYCNDDIAPEYMKFIFLSDLFNNVKDSLCSGTTQRAINNENLGSIQIPLPPFPEQKAIAKVLSTIQEAIEAQDKIIDAAKQLKKSLMKHLFTYGPVPISEAENVQLKETEIGPVPEHWKVVRLENVITEEIKNGAFVRRDRFGKGVPFLNVADTYSRVSADLRFVERIEATVSETELYKIQPNDLFYVRSSLKREGVGQCCIIEHSTEPAIYDCHLMRVRVNWNRVIPKYLAYFSVSPIGKESLVSRSKTTTMTTINQQGLASFMFPLPSYDSQELITNLLSSIDRKIETEENRKKALQAMFKTMLHHLMTGKVRVKDLEGTIS